MTEWEWLVILVFFTAVPLLSQNEDLMRRIGVVWTWERIAAATRYVLCWEWRRE